MAKVKSTALKIEKRIENPELKKLGIYSYDFDNLYPQRVTDIVNDSGTAVTALRTHTKFITGNGASDKDFGKQVINRKGTTINKLIRKMANSLGEFNGIPIHVNYNAIGQKIELSFIPFEYCRLCLDDDKVDADIRGKIAVYDDWQGTKHKGGIKKENIDFIDKYDPSKVFEQVEMVEVETEGLDESQILAKKWEKYNGQVYYWTPSGSNEYPLAPFDSVLEDMQTEGQLKRFKHSTSAKNFLASHILVTGIEEGETDENGNVLPVENSIADVMVEFQGGDGGGTMMHLQKEHADEPLELIKVDIQNYDGLYEYTENSCRESIRRPFMTPSVLMNESKGGSIGKSEELADAAYYYNDVTAPERNIISEMLEDLCKDFYKNVNTTGDFTIEPLKYDKPITLEYFPYYTKNEIRESNGDLADETVSSEQTILAVELGVGGTQSLTAILADPVLTTEQKRGSLKVLFGLSDEDINTMLGESQINPNTR